MPPVRLEVDAATAAPAPLSQAYALRLLDAGFDAAPVGIGVFSLQPADFGRLQRVNDAACRFFGRSRETLLALRWQDVTPPEHRESDEVAMRALMESGDQITGRLKRYVGGEGEVIWGRMSTALVNDEAGRPLVGIAQVEDVTGSVLRDEALRATEERLGMVFHQSPVAMALLDYAPGREGTVVEANESFGVLVGRPLDEVIGANVDAFTHPDDRSKVHTAHDALIGGGERYEFVKRYVRPDGTIRIGEVHAGPVHDQHGRVRYGIGTIVDVTDRDQAENARKTIVDAALEGIVSIDGKGLIIVFNAAAERIFGHRCADVVGKPMAQILIPPESRGKHLAGVERFRDLDAGYEQFATLPVTAMRADGSRIPVEITVRRTGADPPEFTAFVRDRSEHARAERRQRDAEQLFQSVFADSAVAMAVQNVNGRMVEVNDELCRFLGRSSAELLGAEPADFTHPDDRVEHDEILAELIAGAGGIRREKRFLRADGALVWAFVHASLIRDESGRPRGIQQQLVDVTARHEAHTLMEAILDSLGEGVIALDGEGLVQGANPAACALLGIPKAELEGRSMHAIIHAHTGPAADCPIYRVVLTGEPVRVEDDTFRRGDGSLLPVAYSASPLERGSGGGVVVVFSDISERKTREQALNRRLEAFDVLERIRAAMREDRLVLHSQPILDLATDEVLQEELLLRMVDEAGELVPPGDFLPVAEEHGLIADIDRWVIGRAAEIAATGRHVEVNVSGVTLGNRDLVYWVEEALATSGADPRNITFEITETALTNDLEQAARFADHVALLGCGFALDDFGTGYGSFTLLKRLPISYLKIDMEFVQSIAHDEADRHVVNAVVSLAKGLGMRTIAEGVETAETLEILRGIGVDFAQGYLIGRPAPMTA